MINRLLQIAALVLALALSAQAETWNFDKAHSSIGFSAQHMLISSVSGKFEDYDGAVIFDSKSPEKGSAEITIQVKSINTDNVTRDNHLKTSDFFEADKYPTITFKSTKITKIDEKNFTMTGDLTMKGVTKSVTLQGKLNGIVVDPWGMTRAGFTMTGAINRHDYNIAWDNKLQDGSLIVGEQVDLNLHVEVTKVESK